MNLDTAIPLLGEKIDKSETYLKGLHTKEKNILLEQFGDALPETRIDELAFSKIANKYELNKNEIDKLIKGEEPMEEEMFDEVNEDIEEMVDELETDLEVYDEVDDLKPDDEEDDITPSGFKSWEEAFAGIPDPKEKSPKEFTKTPSLIVEIGPTYYLRVIPEEDVYIGEFEGKYGKYNKRAFKVLLDHVSDSAMYDVKYTKGDFAGNNAFVDGQKYTLWMDDKCFGHFKMFWMAVRNKPLPDDRLFSFRHTKKGNYNVWTFGEVNG